MRKWILVLLLLVQGAPVQAVPGPSAALVVLLHGLNRSKSSMQPMANALQKAGFGVCNVQYPSRDFTVEVLAKEHVLPAIRRCLHDHPAALKVHFVTHSLGGIILRQLRAEQAPLTFGRIVMLGTPNAGSEIVDKLGDLTLFQWMNGPAAQEVGTGAPLLERLGPTDLEVGIIAGNSTLDPISSTMIPGDDDGKVSIEHTKLAGMRDFIVLPVSHTFLMKNAEVIRQTLLFLQNGTFDHARH